jgi:PPM family protein phosphatase
LRNSTAGGGLYQSLLGLVAAVNYSTCLQVAAITDVGMRRTTNQDAHALVVADTAELWQARGHFLMVADGMGAHAAGELASKIAADGIPHLYHKYRDLSPPEAIEKAIRETNAEVHRRGMANPDFHNMGTTCSVLVLLPQGALAAHIGDSRVYRLRGNQLHQLTFDHSLQWELRASGQLPPGSEIAASVPKNVITRSLGPNANVQIDLEGPWPIELGDVYLLCSDGLTGRVEDHELGPIMAALPTDEAARVLVDLANLRGGPDNCTILIAKVVKPEMATAAGAAPPLTVGAAKGKQGVHPGIWIGAGVAALAALVILALGYYVPAAVVGAAALIAAGFGLVQQFGMRGGVTLEGGRYLGKGPYTTTPCVPGHDFLSKLADVIEELREAARDGNWNIDWRTFDEHCNRAQLADDRKSYTEGVREYCRAISFMMKELRSQGTRKSDSTIQY